MSAQQGGKGGRPSGLPKTGGRQRGTPNRSTTLLREKLAALGCDPAEDLVKIANDLKCPAVLKTNIYSTLLPYVYPKRSAVDDSVEERESGKTVEWALDMAREILRIYGAGATEQKEQSTPAIEAEPSQTTEEPDEEPDNEN